MPKETRVYKAQVVINCLIPIETPELTEKALEGLCDILEEHATLYNVRVVEVLTPGNHGFVEEKDLRYTRAPGEVAVVRRN